ncbi:MAG: hypothetical protein A3G30_01505 [Chlamydiae bacterium RIFCSPLOWO2_12_FULL_49_12]|nr:MAG: hypothetical protein A3G30_01505 [Chlamydiae bacterium RIFCSPLOWO2_12_FULL_49_12]
MGTKQNEHRISMLKKQSVFNEHATHVVHQLFLENDFFDPHDVIQVKYEMLRWAQSQKDSIQKTAKLFGFSRPAFYQAQASFEQEGLAGLMPKKRGPKNRHKLSEEILEFVREAMAKDPALTTSGSVLLIKQRYGLNVHARSVMRALNPKQPAENEKKND